MTYLKTHSQVLTAGAILLILLLVHGAMNRYSSSPGDSFYSLDKWTGVVDQR
jgi:hypothetical protein